LQSKIYIHIGGRTSWGFKNLAQELTFATMEMGVEEEQTGPAAK
jgi:hypothetical protein